tara:strand:+ start:1908 stop:2198 length:291 start_codon:yes stop_codon:yes gene_type:complete
MNKRTRRKLEELNEYLASFENQMRVKLVGRKIVEVRYLTKEESDSFGWSYQPLVIYFDDSKILIPSSDEEMNNGGSLILQDPHHQTEEVIGVQRNN